MPALRSVFIEVGILRRELQIASIVISTILLANLERIKCIALKLSLAI